MFQRFQFRHIPALIAATALVLTGLWPLIGDPRAALLEFGFPDRIANAPETWPVIQTAHARHTCMGILMFIFYSRGQYDVLDTFITLLSSYLVLVDCFVLWKEGVRGWIAFRICTSGPFLAMGLAGFTRGPVH